jgi:hypothetical protein
LVSVTEAASVARLHPKTIWKWLATGRIRGWGYRGSTRVALSDLLPEIEAKGEKWIR